MQGAEGHTFWQRGQKVQRSRDRLRKQKARTANRVGRRVDFEEARCKEPGRTQLKLDLSQVLGETQCDWCQQCPRTTAPTGCNLERLPAVWTATNRAGSPDMGPHHLWILVLTLFILFLKILSYFWLYWVFIATYGLSLVAMSGGDSLIRVHMLPIAVASLVAEHGFWGRSFGNCAT